MNRAYNTTSHELQSHHCSCHHSSNCLRNDLKEELIRLRQSSQDAIQKSWSETEQLQQEKEHHLHQIESLKEQLLQSKEQLTQSKKQNDELMIWLRIHHPQEAGPPKRLIANDSADTNGVLRSSWPQQIFNHWRSISGASNDGSGVDSEDAIVPHYDQSNNNDDDDEDMSVTSDGYSCANDYDISHSPTRPKVLEQTKDEYIQQLHAKISARDAAIESLEQTIEMQLKLNFIQPSQKESVDSNSDDIINSKNVVVDDDDDDTITTVENTCEPSTCPPVNTISTELTDVSVNVNSLQRIRFLENYVDSLEEKLMNEQVVVQEQEHSMVQYRQYIERMANELENMVTVMNKAQQSSGESSHSQQHRIPQTLLQLEQEPFKEQPINESGGASNTEIELYNPQLVPVGNRQA